MRRLGDNKLGPEGGMALAEALKSNTTLEHLGSAALPLNPPVHASVYSTPSSVLSFLSRTPAPFGWVARRPCTLTLAPAGRRLDDNDFGDDAQQALRAAARSGLQLRFNCCDE